MNGVALALPTRHSVLSRIGGVISGRVLAAIVTGVGIGASAWVAGLLLARTSGLASPAHDLAFFQQLVWHLGTDGRWVSSFHQGSFLGLHFSPILVVPAAVERFVGADARVLSLFHAAAVGALGPATFLLARAALQPARLAGIAAAGLAVALPLSAALQEVARADFHPEAVGLVMALLAGWAGLTRRPRAMWILAVAALLTREDVAYAVVVVGLLVAARGRGTRSTRRQGLALAGVAITWAAIVFLVAMPWIRDGGFVDTHRYYRWLGTGPEALLAPFNRTDAVLAALNRPASWFFVGGMVLTYAGLPLLRPRWLLLAVPPLAAVLLSAHPPQAALHLQYPLILIAPLTVAGVLGLRRAIAVGLIIRRRLRGRGRFASAAMAMPIKRVVVAALAIGLALPAIGVAFAQGSLPPFNHGRDAFFTREAAFDRVRSLAAGVPDAAFLTVDPGLAAPLANRATIRVLSTAPVTARSYVLFDRAAWFPSTSSKERRARFLALAMSRSRPVLADDGRFVLLGPEPGAGLP